VASHADSPGAGDSSTQTIWRSILQARRTGCFDADPAWQALYGPLLVRPDAPFVIGQIGQSLDGRIATRTGDSRYINGREAIVHLHRLRALVDAVVIGVGTALADDPALTVRHVEGVNPCRVVIDPGARTPASAKVFAQDGCRRLLLTRPDARPSVPDGVEVVAIAPGVDGRLHPRHILDALAARGLCRVLIEGGAFTVSGFLHAHCLDRLHIAVAPLIIGSGREGLVLPAIEELSRARRPVTRVFPMPGGDVLFDCDLSGT